MWKPYTRDPTLSFEYHSHNIHPRYPLRGTATLVIFFRYTIVPKRTTLINYRAYTTLDYSQHHNLGPVNFPPHSNNSALDDITNRHQSYYYSQLEKYKTP